MNLQFVSATADDIPVIFSQAKKLIDTYEDITAIDYDKVIAWVERKITSCISAYTRVVLDEDICGYFHLCEDGELDDLYVLDGFRGQRIGSQILNKCINESPNNLWLYVFSRNTRAIAFYERFGFSVREQIGTTRLIMVRNG